MSLTYSLRAFAIALTAFAAGPAVAADREATEALWDRFAGYCSAVVAADSPADHAAGLEAGIGGVGGTEDGAIRNATVTFEDALVDAELVTLIVTVSVFDGGRLVQCMLQVFDPFLPFDGLADLAGSRAAELLGEGEGLIVAGGPLYATGLGGAGEDQGVEEIRISTAGFPPTGIVTVRSLDRVVSLILSVLQADGS